MVTDRLWGTGHSMRSPMSYAPCKDTCPPLRYDNNTGQLHCPLYQPNLPGLASSVTAQRGIGFSVAKSLTLPTSRDHMNLVRNMLIGSQLRMLLLLLVFSCLLYPLPFICLELSGKVQWVVSNCKHTSIFLNDGHFGRHPRFLLKLQMDSPELLVYYSAHISGAILKISACSLFQAYS